MVSEQFDFEMMDNTIIAQMEEQLYSLQLSQIELKETSKLHGKMLTEILQCLENLRFAEISTGKASRANHVVVEPGLRHCSSQDDDLIGFCGSGQSVTSEDDSIRIADPHLCNYGNVRLGDPHPCNSGNGVLSVQENHHVESISMKEFVFLNENVVDYEKLIIEILRRLESLQTAENSIWKISQVDHPAVEKDIQIGQPNLTSLVEFSPTHHHYIDHPDHSSNEEDLRMEEVEDGFLSLVEMAKAAANKRKMDDVAAIGLIEGSYTAVVRGSKSLPWQQQTTLDTASKLKITMPSDAAYDDSFSKSLCNRIARFSTHLMKRIQSSYQLFIGRETMKHFFQIVCGPLCSSNLISVRSQGYPIFYLGGEWECPQWNFFNYGRNAVCLRCDCKRPAETPLGASGPFGCFWPCLWFGHGQTLMVPTPTSLNIESRLAAID